MAIEFSLSLGDKITGPANRMAGAFGSLATQAKSLQGAMLSLEKQSAKAAALGDFEKVGKLRAQYATYGDALGQVKSQMSEASGEAEIFNGAVEKMGGVTGIVTAVIGAQVAALALLGTALVKGAQMALEATEAFEKMRASLDALSGGAGPQTIALIDSLRSHLGMTRAELAPLAEQLLAMGIPAKNLAAQLTTLASIKAIGVDGGTEAYLALLKKLEGQTKVSGKSLAELYKTGVNVNEIAAKLGMSTKQLQQHLKNGTLDANKFKSALAGAITAKGAKALEEQANSLTGQVAILKENFTKLFEGIDAGPFLKELKSLFGIVDQNTASGKALHFLFKQLFEGLFKVAAKVLPYVKSFLLGMVIGALKVYIALKPVTKEFAKLFSGGTNPAAIQFFAKAGEKLVRMLLVVAQVTAAFFKFGAAIAGAAKVGANFVDGLITGIQSRVGAAVAAVKDLGTSLLSGIKGILGIHSPSREMMKLGSFTAQGFAQGVTAANDNVSAAASGMSASATKATMTTGGGGGGGRSVGNVSVEININGAGGDAQTIAAKVHEAVTEVFEQIGLTEGLGSAA